MSSQILGYVSNFFLLVELWNLEIALKASLAFLGENLPTLHLLIFIVSSPPSQSTLLLAPFFLSHMSVSQSVICTSSQPGMTDVRQTLRMTWFFGPRQFYNSVLHFGADYSREVSQSEKTS
jgi:hypothetical protein